MSGASPTTGAGPNAGERSGRRRAAPSGPLEVALEHGRWRHFGWAAVGIAAGGLLVIKLGIVGKAVGVVVCLLSLLALRAFVLTLINAPGRLRIGHGVVSLPRGVCRNHPVELPIDRVRNAFFLRRVVPWTRTGPLLIVETDSGTFTYPRDWFASDSDQQRVAAAINHRLGHTA